MKYIISINLNLLFQSLKSLKNYKTDLQYFWKNVNNIYSINFLYRFFIFNIIFLIKYLLLK